MVLNGEFEITDDKVLSRVIRASFTICTDRIQLNYMLKTEVGRRWYGRFLQLNRNRELIDKTGMNILLASKITWCMV